MSTKGRNASPTIAGFLFQVNVAIYFMFRYLKEIYSIRVEGSKEDVEIKLNNKKKYMIQAKATTNNINDDSGNILKLNMALKSLSEADGKDVERLYYASNMINPLKSTTPEFYSESGITIKKYNELSDESKGQIDKQIQKNKEEYSKEKKNFEFDTSKLYVIRIPFFGDDEYQKYKFIFEEAKIALSAINDSIANKHRTIVNLCVSKMFNNGAKIDDTINIKKTEFCNWIILTELEGMNLSDDYSKIGIDETDYYEAYQKYTNYIDEKMSSYESYMKVYSMYNREKTNKSISISEFVNKEKYNLYNYFFADNINENTLISEEKNFDIYVSQIVSYALLQKRMVIKKIKECAGL